jgi:hypothetical protein
VPKTQAYGKILNMMLLRTALARALLLTLTAALAGGCATTAFTQGYQREHALNDADLKHVRFYTSSDLVLQRSSAVRDASAPQGGVFVATANNLVHEIVIPKGTPLILLQVVRAPASASQAQTEYLQLALAADAPAKSLWFSSRRGPTGRYELTPVSQLGEDAQPVLATTPAIRYDGMDYRLRDEAMWQVFLCVGEVMKGRIEVSGSASASVSTH